MSFKIVYNLLLNSPRETNNRRYSIHQCHLQFMEKVKFWGLKDMLENVTGINTPWQKLRRTVELVERGQSVLMIDLDTQIMQNPLHAIQKIRKITNQPIGIIAPNDMMSGCGEVNVGAVYINASHSLSSSFVRLVRNRDRLVNENMSEYIKQRGVTYFGKKKLNKYREFWTSEQAVVTDVFNTLFSGKPQHHQMDDFFLRMVRLGKATGNVKSSRKSVVCKRYNSICESNTISTNGRGIVKVSSTESLFYSQLGRHSRYDSLPCSAIVHCMGKFSPCFKNIYNYSNRKCNKATSFKYSKCFSKIAYANIKPKSYINHS